MRTDFKIPKELSNGVVDFALNTGVQYFTKNPIGAGRRFCNINRVDIPLTNAIKQFAQECYSNLNVAVKEEHLLGNFIGVNFENAFVHQHIDQRNNENDWHVRLNFMVQKPDSGGDVLIQGNQYSIDEGCSWINFASEWKHGSTPVIGKRERIVLSLGNYIQQSDAKRLLELYNIE